MFFEKHLDVFEPIHPFRQLETGKINSFIATDVIHIDTTGSSTVGLVNAFYAEYLNSMVFNTKNLHKKTKLGQEHIILHELLHTKYSVSNLGIDDKKLFTIKDGDNTKEINLVELDEAIADINGLAEMSDYLEKPEMFDEFAILLCSILKRGYEGHYLGEDNYTQTAALFIAPLLGEFFPVYKISADLSPKELTLLIESKKITKEIFLKYVRNANSKLASYVQEIKVQASNADKE